MILNTKINLLKKFVVNAFQDTEVLFELRQMLFGIVIAVAITYGFNAFYLEPLSKTEKKSRSDLQELTASLGGNQVEKYTGMQLRKLQGDKEELSKKIDVLTFKENTMRDQFDGGVSSEPFENVIFTLLPFSPVDIEEGFVKMNILDIRSLEYFEIYPVSVEGRIQYFDFISYLQYLEGSVEVGLIDNLKLEMSPSTPFEDSGEINFTLELGRIKLLPQS